MLFAYVVNFQKNFINNWQNAYKPIIVLKEDFNLS